RALKTWTQTQDLRRVFDSFRVSTGTIMSYREGPEKQRHLRIQRTEPDRFLGMLYRLAIAPGKRQAVAEIAVGRRGTRIEQNRPAKSRDRFLGAFFHEGQIAERDLSPGIAIIEGDRAN